MRQLKDEIIIDSMESVKLTNYRIVQEYGKSHFHSIFLENISSIQTQYKHKPILFFLAILCVIGGVVLFYISYEDFSYLLICGLGLIFIICYFFSRKHMLSISPDGGKSIDITFGRVSHEKLHDFITNVQDAKREKVDELRITTCDSQN
ncbi:MAG: hypothetical protein LBP67_02355 [Bacteroidales bacterium]|jgi:hypothetical protein|nr:hypothetical protein [Bacteroidales bacterium]